MSERARELIDRYEHLGSTGAFLLNNIRTALDPGPTVEMAGLHADIQQGFSFTVIFQWDRPITGFAPDKLLLSNGHALDTVDPSDPDGDIFTYLVHPATDYVGHFHIVVPDNTVIDGEGRINRAMHGYVNIVPRET